MSLSRPRILIRRRSRRLLSALALVLAVGGAQVLRPVEALGLTVIEAPVDTPISADSAGRDQPDGSFGLASDEVAPPPAAPMSETGESAVVVVELFTAQGCSTCPPADALIADLAEREDVLALSWHVDYWDYLGWPDSFAAPGHSARQQGYAAAAGERSVYTPQIIVDGEDTLIGVGQGGLMALIGDHAARPPLVAATALAGRGSEVVELTPLAEIGGGASVSLVRYLPQRRVMVEGGENSGRVMEYRNVVVGSEVLANWPARAPLRVTVRTGAAQGGYPPDTRHALIVQQRAPQGYPGAILAAVRLD